MQGQLPRTTRRDTCSILGTRVDVVGMATAVSRIVSLASERTASYVCAANVHMVMEGVDDPAFRSIVNASDLVVPDGMPLAWTQRIFGFRNAARVRGPDLAIEVVKAAADNDLPVALYGGSPDVCERFAASLGEAAPTLRIAAAISPPYGPIDDVTHGASLGRLADSGARIVLVGLGCPKQEKWMAMHVERLGMVLLGVGAAFDFHAGTLRQAPLWMQRSGLEWAFRLAQEPRRLWRRYARHNSRFVLGVARQWWSERGRGSTPRRSEHDEG